MNLLGSRYLDIYHWKSIHELQVLTSSGTSHSEVMATGRSRGSSGAWREGVQRKGGEEGVGRSGE